MSRRSERSVTTNTSDDREITDLKESIAEVQRKLQRARAPHIKAAHSETIAKWQVELDRLEAKAMEKKKVAMPSTDMQDNTVTTQGADDGDNASKQKDTAGMLSTDEGDSTRKGDNTRKEKDTVAMLGTDEEDDAVKKKGTVGIANTGQRDKAVVKKKGTVGSANTGQRDNAAVKKKGTVGSANTGQRDNAAVKKKGAVGIANTGQRDNAAVKKKDTIAMASADKQDTVARMSAKKGDPEIDRTSDLSENVIEGKSDSPPLNASGKGISRAGHSGEAPTTAMAMADDMPQSLLAEEDEVEPAMTLVDELNLDEIPDGLRNSMAASVLSHPTHKRRLKTFGRKMVVPTSPTSSEEERLTYKDTPGDTDEDRDGVSDDETENQGGDKKRKRKDEGNNGKTEKRLKLPAPTTRCNMTADFLKLDTSKRESVMKEIQRFSIQEGHARNRLGTQASKWLRSVPALGRSLMLRNKDMVLSCMTAIGTNNVQCFYHATIRKTNDVESRYGDCIIIGQGERAVNRKEDKEFKPRREGFLHCGCYEDAAVLETIMWKMFDAEEEGVEESWKNMYLDPRQRYFLSQILEKWFGFRVDDLFEGKGKSADLVIRLCDQLIVSAEKRKAERIAELGMDFGVPGPSTLV